MAGIPFPELTNLVANPYHPPSLGSDEPHQGVDLAVLGQGKVALAGSPVQAVLAGSVAAVIRDRFPYGNAIVVETDLENGELLPKGLGQPVLAPTPVARAPLTCPPFSPQTDRHPKRVSLYVLYAHLEYPPILKTGDFVACGQLLGVTGSSGNALNPHLHLEVRLGLAGARFSSLAHYDPSATLEEMSAYCEWRISGWFQPVDPLMLFPLP
jgi:murein DD-endopeptidase MepM/ murein hydrolase activator NlpD